MCSDHPRSRGEYFRVTLSFSRANGSSPLSRGIRNSQGRAGRWLRIIPALAGNTVVFRKLSEQPRDHPRSRGEYCSVPPPSRMRPGSSPLSRGIPIRTKRRVVTWGIIPALAGNTTVQGMDLWENPDHPRSRGEYVFQTSHLRHVLGSSPLSRGIRAMV